MLEKCLCFVCTHAHTNTLAVQITHKRGDVTTSTLPPRPCLDSYIPLPQLVQFDSCHPVTVLFFTKTNDHPSTLT